MIVRGSAELLPLKDDSIDALITSPPYNVSMKYDGVPDNLPVADYEEFVAHSALEFSRVLKPGGRLWLNAPTAMSVGADERWNPSGVWLKHLNQWLGYRDTIVWHQQAHADPTAWGSLHSPNAPNIRGRWEAILLFFKDHWSRGRVEKNDIDPLFWGPWTQNVWVMPCANSKEHPAVFPEELPRRAIYLSTWKDDVVLDPFVGTGVTVRVAKRLGRRGIGVELSQR